MLYHFFVCFPNGHFNADNSTQGKLEKQVLPPRPAHLLPDHSIQKSIPLAEPAMWQSSVRNLPRLSPPKTSSPRDENCGGGDKSLPDILYSQNYTTE